MKSPSGRTIVLRFNERLQPVGNEAGILSDVLGLLGFDYTKFPICEKDWRKVRSKDKIYNECVKERIAKIEQHDESSRLLSQNDLLAQALRKEHSSRVRGVDIGPTSSQVFSTNSHQSGNETQREETQRVLLELQAKLVAEKTKRQAMESPLRCLIQGQGGKLPPDVTA
ncbi:hypothetical protein Ahy_A07g031747 [Arachis hypogaea]|uniref:Uncharacterized protein n=1 Tax=Arachis hypogaea TaxID=3818 RepID=A0A445C4U3_ARAHY|nr:hypothetical protein Ahy_A07g031747 [Arachis hypogaea]